MKWLKSTTQRSYKFEGKVIPQAVTKDNTFLALNDSEFLEWLQKPVFKSLHDNGAIFVTDKEPTSPTQQLSNVTQRNAALVLENTQLKQQLESALKSAGDNSEVASLKAALDKQKADDLAEIKALKKEKEAEIAELKKRLAEMESKK